MRNVAEPSRVGDDEVKARTLGFVLIAVGLIGVSATAWGVAVSGHDPGGGPWGTSNGVHGTTTCNLPTLPGQNVDVVLTSMGGGMMGGHMMSISLSPSTVAAGDVSFRAWNEGSEVHELVILPLPSGEPGAQPVGPDNQVSESGSLGEASNACGEGAGEGIPPGSASWVTLHLDPGRYELICNLPGHYAGGMFAELDVA
jgi:uncharacterized cupredoxin-like copper-binding protein